MKENTKDIILQVFKLAVQLIEDKPSKQTLLTEYKALQHDISSTGTSYWTMAAIFIGISSASLMGLVYSVLANQCLLQMLLRQLRGEQAEIQPFQIIIIVAGMLSVLLLSAVRLRLRRITFLQQINYERMRDIESLLGIWKSWRVHGVDHWDKKKSDFDSEIADKDRLTTYKPQSWWRNWRTVSSSSGGYDFIFAILIFFWLYLVFTIAVPIKFPLGIVSIIIVGVIDICVILFTRTKKKEQPIDRKTI